MQENEQCQNCEKYEYCTMRKDKEICLEYSNIFINKSKGE